MPRAMSASARMLTTDARSLASLPSGRSGCVAVQGLGDDDAEHGVAEEFESLVVRQAAVFVGVGAVRQGALKQAGVDGDAQCVGELGLVRGFGENSHAVRPREPACRRTDRSCCRRCAATSARHRRGSDRAPESVRSSSTASGAPGCCCATFFRFGTATEILLTSRAGRMVRVRRCRPRANDARAAQRGSSSSCACSGREIVEPVPAGGAQPGAIRPAQRRPGQGQDHCVTHHRFDVEADRCRADGPRPARSSRPWCCPGRRTAHRPRRRAHR